MTNQNCICMCKGDFLNTLLVRHVPEPPYFVRKAHPFGGGPIQFFGPCCLNVQNYADASSLYVVPTAAPPGLQLVMVKFNTLDGLRLWHVYVVTVTSRTTDPPL